MHLLARILSRRGGSGHSAVAERPTVGQGRRPPQRAQTLPLLGCVESPAESFQAGTTSR